MNLALPMPQDPRHMRLWAKSPARGREIGESLASHTAEVLTRLAQLRRLRPSLESEAGCPGLWRALYWGGFIHDWGKVAAGFQAQVRPGGPKWGRRHEVLSLAFLPYVTSLSDPESMWIAAAIAAHHRDTSVIKARYSTPSAIRRVVEEVDGTGLALLWDWMREFGESWAAMLGLDDVGLHTLPASSETVEAFRARATEDIAAALDGYFDWSRQLNDRFAPDPPAIVSIALRGLLITADHSASAHAPSFERTPLPTPPDLRQLFAERRGTLHPHQEKCAVAVGSIALTAPTGSGKTESALLWAANQSTSSGAVPRLFYILPYQASMNAMRRRLADDFGESSVALQHGKARHTLYRFYLEREQTPQRAAWAARAEQNLARLQVPPIRVLSPYQILKAFYRLPGYEAAISDIYGGAIICDEIHAYEVKRLALIVAMLGFLSRHLRTQICLMSATFPSMIKRWLAEEVNPLLDISASAATQRDFIRHRVALRPGELTDPAAIQGIVQRARSGLNILICCNTVSRAQMVLELLESAGLTPDLLHSRFNAADRNAKESRLQDEMGCNSTRSARGAVMVATQVVEVSLDIDFDALYTDPAPLDALLQRFGRINRARKVPRRDVFVFEGPVIHNRPYDETLVKGALHILAQEFGPEGGDLDESRVGVWLDSIYNGEIEARWEVEYRRHKREFEQAILGTLAPFEASSELEDAFYRAFDGVEVLPLSLRDEYLRRWEEEPLSASELLVPIRWRQLARIKKDGDLVERLEIDRTPVVDLPYSSKRGLGLG